MTAASQKISIKKSLLEVGWVERGGRKVQGDLWKSMSYCLLQNVLIFSKTDKENSMLMTV